MFHGKQCRNKIVVSLIKRTLFQRREGVLVSSSKQYTSFAIHPCLTAKPFPIKLNSVVALVYSSVGIGPPNGISCLFGNLLCIMIEHKDNY